MVMEIISILLGILILLGFSQGEALGNMHNVAFALLDLPSLVIILVFTVPVLVRGGVWKDFERAFRLLKRGYSCHLSELRRTQDVVEMLQKQVFCAGIMAMLLINTYYIMGAAVNTTLIAGVFRAGGDSRFGLICDVIDMWVYAVPLGFLAAFVFKLPVLWVYFLLCTDEFVKWPWVIRHYRRGIWLKNITREDLF